MLRVFYKGLACSQKPSPLSADHTPAQPKTLQFFFEQLLDVATAPEVATAPTDATLRGQISDWLTYWFDLSPRLPHQATYRGLPCVPVVELDVPHSLDQAIDQQAFGPLRETITPQLVTWGSEAWLSGATMDLITSHRYLERCSPLDLKTLVRIIDESHKEESTFDRQSFIRECVDAAGGSRRQCGQQEKLQLTKTIEKARLGYFNDSGSGYAARAIHMMVQAYFEQLVSAALVNKGFAGGESRRRFYEGMDSLVACGAATVCDTPISVDPVELARVVQEGFNNRFKSNRPDTVAMLKSLDSEESNAHLLYELTTTNPFLSALYGGSNSPGDLTGMHPPLSEVIRWMASPEVGVLTIAQPSRPGGPQDVSHLSDLVGLLHSLPSNELRKAFYEGLKERVGESPVCWAIKTRCDSLMGPVAMLSAPFVQGDAPELGAIFDLATGQGIQSTIDALNRGLFSATEKISDAIAAHLFGVLGETSSAKRSRTLQMFAGADWLKSKRYADLKSQIDATVKASTVSRTPESSVIPSPRHEGPRSPEVLNGTLIEAIIARDTPQIDLLCAEMRARGVAFCSYAFTRILFPPGCFLPGFREPLTVAAVQPVADFMRANNISWSEGTIRKEIGATAWTRYLCPFSPPTYTFGSVSEVYSGLFRNFLTRLSAREIRMAPLTVVAVLEQLVDHWRAGGLDNYVDCFRQAATYCHQAHIVEPGSPELQRLLCLFMEFRMYSVSRNLGVRFTDICGAQPCLGENYSHPELQMALAPVLRDLEIAVEHARQIGLDPSLGLVSRRFYQNCYRIVYQCLHQTEKDWVKTSLALPVCGPRWVLTSLPAFCSMFLGHCLENDRAFLSIFVYSRAPDITTLATLDQFFRAHGIRLTPEFVAELRPLIAEARPYCSRADQATLDGLFFQQESVPVTTQPSLEEPVVMESRSLAPVVMSSSGSRA